MTKLTFEQWKAQVNRVLIAKCGMTADDLPDADYRIWYDRGVAATVAASRALRAARYY